MYKNRNSERSRRAKDWFVYILVCSNKSFYTGISPNLDKRLHLHNIGEGARYTKLRLPVNLVYFRKYSNKSEARKREIQIKGWSRKEKRIID